MMIHQGAIGTHGNTLRVGNLRRRLLSCLRGGNLGLQQPEPVRRQRHVDSISGRSIVAGRHTCMRRAAVGSDFGVHLHGAARGWRGGGGNAGSPRMSA